MAHAIGVESSLNLGAAPKIPRENPVPAKNPDIEKLRAMAILMVVLWHYSGILFGPFGLGLYYLGSWTGVDLFFCISGYVIMKSLMASGSEIRIGRFLSVFYIKRIFRIWRVFRYRP